MVSKSKRRREARQRAAKTGSKAGKRPVRSKKVRIIKKQARKKTSGVRQLRTNGVENAGLGLNTNMSRVPRGSFQVAGSGNTLRIRGCDFVGRVTIPSAGSDSGDTLFSLLINPNNIVNTRLQAMAQLYEKYKFRAIRMHFTSNENTAAKGAIVHGFLPDPDDELLEGQAKINQMVSLVGHTQHKTFESGASVYINPKGAPWLFMQGDGSDSRLTDQCIYHVVAYSHVGYDSELTGEIGELEIEYDIELSGVSNQFVLENSYYLQTGGGEGVDVTSEIVTVGGLPYWYPLASQASPIVQIETTGRQLSGALVDYADGKWIDLIKAGYREGDVLLMVAVYDFAYLEYSSTGPLWNWALRSGVALTSTLGDADSTQFYLYKNPSAEIGLLVNWRTVKVISSDNAWVAPRLAGGSTITNAVLGANVSNGIYITRLYNGSRIARALSVSPPEVDDHATALAARLHLIESKLKEFGLFDVVLPTSEKKEKTGLQTPPRGLLPSKFS